uniref:Uncharacterized protein n=1 Tax=Arundo donax TaxID=35708 RepID=A0A0A9EJW1_ARUDO
MDWQCIVAKIVTVLTTCTPAVQLGHFVYFLLAATLCSCLCLPYQYFSVLFFARYQHIESSIAYLGST